MKEHYPCAEIVIAKRDAAGGAVAWALERFNENQ